MEPYVAALLPGGGSSGSAAGLPPGGRETLDPDTTAAEQLILALRLDRGLSESAATVPRFAEVRPWAESAGLVESVVLDGELRVRLTTRGRLLSNELFARLL